MEQDYVDKQIDAKIIEINNNDNIYEIGSVVNVRDFIIEVTGINNVMFYEKINIANKAIGYVNSINENTVTVAVLKIDSPINVGDMVYSGAKKVASGVKSVAKAALNGLRSAGKSVVSCIRSAGKAFRSLFS